MATSLAKAAPPPYVATTDTPPIYLPEGSAASAPDPNETLDPAVFTLHGRFVYPQLPSGEPDSEPVYQLSRAIHTQGRATETIEFQRLDPRVRTAHDDGSPVVFRHAKDIYVLRHQNPMHYAGIPFSARLLPCSRKTLGEVAIEKSPLFHHGYRAMKAVSDEERVALERKGVKVKKGEYHFVMKEAQGEETWLWSGPDGKALASQVCEAPAAEGDEAHYKLNVLVPLSRRVRDGLVATWCLWMWHLHIEKTTVRKTWEDRQCPHS